MLERRMLERMMVWGVIILLNMIVLPICVVFVGDFYRPALLESVRSRAEGRVDVASIEREREGDVLEALAGAMSSDMHEEALRAQAVIVRTYLMRRELGIVEEGELVQLSEEDMRVLWGDTFDSVYAVYEQAVADTEGQVILHDGELIEPIYHMESAGYTRDGESLYNLDIPYLKAVESRYDTVATDKVILKSEVVEVLEGAYPDSVLDVAYLENQFQIVERDSSGYIKTLQIGNILISGEVFRELFKLPSAAFTIEAEASTMLFRIRGNGHGVGFSQNGANEMAKQGMSYEEILEYYYTDVEVRNE